MSSNVRKCPKMYDNVRKCPINQINCNNILTGQISFYMLASKCKLFIMKKLLYSVSIVLGMVLTTSCGMYSYSQGGYYDYNYGNYGNYNRGTVQTMPNPNGVFVASRNLKPSGTFVIGNPVLEMRWQNMSLIRNGLMVYVYDANGQLINQYDLRIPQQNIHDEYRPIGFSGKHLSVSIDIYGGKGFSAVIVNDGSKKETYYLK